MNGSSACWALAQMPSRPGSIEANARWIIEAAQTARQQGAGLLVTPALALSGAAARDFFCRQGLPAVVADGLRQLCEAVIDMTLVVGYPEYHRNSIYNAVAVIRDGTIVANYRKQRLQDEGCHREHRVFRPGSQPCVFDHQGVSIGLLIDDEVQRASQLAAVRSAGADWVVNPTALPFDGKHPSVREAGLAEQAKAEGVSIMRCNLAGGQDALVFAGHGWGTSARQETLMRAPAFQPGLHYLTWRHGVPRGEIHEPPSSQALVYKALVAAVRDYVDGNGFPGVLIGASGGIDSALTMAIAADALGGERVWAVSMPSRYTADISNTDAADQAGRQGVHYNEMSIESGFAAMLEALAPLFGDREPGTAEENLQARIRGDLLMSLSNKFGHVVLVPSNKSEMAVGYTTLYGDMCGGYAPLKDVYKTWVYRLARFRNQRGEVIPERVITRPPSAELRADQTDSDSLPDYAVLDPIIEAWVEQGASIDDIIRQGHAEDDVRRTVRLIRGAEYKRQQAPIGPRVTACAFDIDRDYPLTIDYGEL